MDVPEWLAGRITVLANGCWQWNGVPNSNGYMNTRVGGKRTGKCWKAHRLVYTRIIGEIPVGLDLDHQCHNRDETCIGGRTCSHRRCVRPDHLDPSSRSTNVQRGRLGTTGEPCPHGGRVKRNCVSCTTETTRRFRERKRFLVCA